MHDPSTWLVLVEQISSQQDKIDLCISSQFEDLSESVDGILASDGVLLSITYVIVGG